MLVYDAQESDQKLNRTLNSCTTIIFDSQIIQVWIQRRQI